MKYPIAPFIQDEPEPQFFSEGTFIRIVDGDTWLSDLDVGHHMAVRSVRLRPQGYDAPETSRPKHPLERYHGQLATERLQELLCRRPYKVHTLHSEDGIVAKKSISRWRSHIWLRNRKLYGVDLMPLAVVMRLEGYQKLPLRLYRDMTVEYEEGFCDEAEALVRRHIQDMTINALAVYENLRSGWPYTYEELIALAVGDNHETT